MPHSHHSHSGQFCRHAKDTLEEVIREAIKQGFEVFGLSEHAPRYRREDLFPEESDLKPKDLEDAYLEFLRTAMQLRSAYGQDLSLLIGVETDYITPLDLSQTTALLEEHQEIDYVVGSVHHVHGVSIDFDKPTWMRAVQTVSAGQVGTTMDVSPNTGTVSLPSVSDQAEPDIEDVRRFLLAYFDAQYEMLQAHQPEVIGHLDLCLLWTPETKLDGDGMRGVWDKVVRNVEYGISYGGLFEANAAAIRKGWKTSYPNPDIMQLILSKGGRICLSDDSHGVSYVGLNYGKMREYLVGQGVKEVHCLVRRDEATDIDEEVGKRGRVKARKLAKWSQHAFWSQER